MPHRILIIDDDPDDVEITRRVLAKSRRDLEVLSSPSGEHALQHLRQSSELPSVVFIDLKMCGMGGIDTVRMIREDDRLRHLPLVIVTNSTLESDMRKAYDAGADSFIHKAFDIDQFSRDLNDLLKRWLQ